MGLAENRLRGSLSKRTGALFETHLDGVFSQMRARGIASITKTPEPLKVIGRTAKQGTFAAIFASKAQPDYTGTLCGGRSVMIEAKFTDSDRITQDRVGEVQAKYLDEHAGLGAACGIVVCIGFMVYGFVPWSDWKNLKETCCHKYVNADDLRKHGWELDGRDIVKAIADRLNTQQEKTSC